MNLAALKIPTDGAAILSVVVVVIILVSGFSSSSAGGSSRGCGSSVKPEIDNRSEKLAAVAARKQCVRLGRCEAVYKRKGHKAGVGVLKLDGHSGP